MDDTLIVAKFATEAEEADWWYGNRHLVEQEFLKAFENGTIRRGTLKARMQEADRTRAVCENVSLDEPDSARAHAAAERHGMSFESFVRLLVHQGLEREESPQAPD